MKKIIKASAIMLTVLLMFSISALAAQEERIVRIMVSPTYIQDRMDVAPQIVDGRVVAPIRFVAEEMGAEVIWDAENWTVIINTRRSGEEEGWRDSREIIEKYGVVITPFQTTEHTGDYNALTISKAGTPIFIGSGNDNMLMITTESGWIIYEPLFLEYYALAGFEVE